MQNFIDLLKQTNRLLQETDSFIRFDLQGHRYQYDIPTQGVHHHRNNELDFF